MLFPIDFLTDFLLLCFLLQTHMEKSSRIETKWEDWICGTVRERSLIFHLWHNVFISAYRGHFVHMHVIVHLGNIEHEYRWYRMKISIIHSFTDQRSFSSILICVRVRAHTACMPRNQIFTPNAESLTLLHALGCFIGTDFKPLKLIFGCLWPQAKQHQRHLPVLRRTARRENCAAWPKSICKA